MWQCLCGTENADDVLNCVKCQCNCDYVKRIHEPEETQKHQNECRKKLNNRMNNAPILGLFLLLLGAAIQFVLAGMSFYESLYRDPAYRKAYDEIWRNRAVSSEVTLRLNVEIWERAEQVSFWGGIVFTCISLGVGWAVVRWVQSPFRLLCYLSSGGLGLAIVGTVQESPFRFWYIFFFGSILAEFIIVSGWKNIHQGANWLIGIRKDKNMTVSALFGVAAIQILVGALEYFLDSGEMGLLDQVTSFNGVFFIALGIAARWVPLQAGIIGGVLYAAFLGFQASRSMDLLMAGLIFKIPVVILLVVAVAGGSAQAKRGLGGRRPQEESP